MTGNPEEARRRCCLTTKDFSILQAMLERRIASGDPILALLRQKLEDATVVSVLAVEPEVATLDSRVIFRVDGGEAETRTLVQQDARGPVGLNLPVSTMRGLSMLGMSEGSKVAVARSGGGQEIILIEKVVYQPEAAKRNIAARAEQPLPAGRPALRLVHSAVSDVPPLGGKWKIRQTHHDDDDPGPSAA